MLVNSTNFGYARHAYSAQLPEIAECISETASLDVRHFLFGGIICKKKTGKDKEETKRFVSEHDPHSNRSSLADRDLIKTSEVPLQIVTHTFF